MSLQPRIKTTRVSVHAPADEKLRNPNDVDHPFNQASVVTWRGGTNSRQASVFGGRARVVGSLALLILIGAARTGAAAADCSGQPNLQETNGHWHYRIDHLNHHKCWYLQTGDQSAGSSPADSGPAVANTTSVASSLASFFTAWKSSPSPPRPDATILAKASEADSAPQKNISPTHHRRWALDEKRTAKSEVRPVESQHAEPQHQQSAAERDELFNEFLRWSMRPQ